MTCVILQDTGEGERKMSEMNCADCMSETHFCTLHQRARIEYEKLNRGDRDRSTDPVYQDLLKKYGEEDELEG